MGCAKGTWAAQYAQDNPHVNVIGIDIREPIIELANARAQRLGITNAYYIYTNANVNISRIINDISKPSAVQRITINFPDPYFKKRHHKRRLVNNAFVRTLAQGLLEGAEVCFQSDVLELCLVTVKSFASGPWFVPCAYHDVNDLEGNKNPTGVLTEREISVLKRKLKVYRISYVRTAAPFCGTDVYEDEDHGDSDEDDDKNADSEKIEKT